MVVLGARNIHLPNGAHDYGRNRHCHSYVLNIQERLYEPGRAEHRSRVRNSDDGVHVDSHGFQSHRVCNTAKLELLLCQSEGCDDWEEEG